MPLVTSLFVLFILLVVCPLDVAGHRPFPLGDGLLGFGYNACRRNPCQNGGRCVDNRVGFGYRCICLPGFSGQNCQIGQNACRINPCQNGGRCVDNLLGFGYRCICPPGFSGQNCQIDINDCAAHPCSNNGTCVDQVNGFTCQCAEGFTGDTCIINIDECASGPCNNNGTCVDQVNGFTCQCAEDFTGDTCDTNIDECASEPCNNNGTCVDQVNGFTCQCAEGFAGVTCHCHMEDQPSIEVDSGIGYPILTEAPISLPKCKDLCLSIVSCDNIIFIDGLCALFDYRLQYRPRQPETPIHTISIKICQDTDECTSGPCNNNGTCVDLANGYTCQCAQGFTGATCDITGP